MKYFEQRCNSCGYTWCNVIEDDKCPICESSYLKSERIINTDTIESSFLLQGGIVSQKTIALIDGRYNERYDEPEVIIPLDGKNLEINLGSRDQNIDELISKFKRELY